MREGLARRQQAQPDVAVLDLFQEGRIEPFVRRTDRTQVNVEGDHPGGIGKQRVDVEANDLRAFYAASCSR